MSSEARLRTRPFGLVSKKDRGWHRTLWNNLWKNTVEALIPQMAIRNAESASKTPETNRKLCLFGIATTARVLLRNRGGALGGSKGEMGLSVLWNSNTCQDADQDYGRNGSFTSREDNCCVRLRSRGISWFTHNISSLRLNPKLFFTTALTNQDNVACLISSVQQ